MNDMTPTREQRTAALEGMGCKRKRVEDARFTQGKGNYVDDLKLPGMLHGDFVRSPHAHARVKSINSEEALKVPGVLAVMATAGLYDDSGKWLYHTGLPAKSGVGGGIIAVSPGKFGIAVISPPLDDAGNSIRAQRAITAISNALGGNPYAVK